MAISNKSKVFFFIKSFDNIELLSLIEKNKQVTLKVNLQ
jgi:hypothetical protein